MSREEALITARALWRTLKTAAEVLSVIPSGAEISLVDRVSLEVQDALADVGGFERTPLNAYTRGNVPGAPVVGHIHAIRTDYRGVTIRSQVFVPQEPVRMDGADMMPCDGVREGAKGCEP